MPRDIFTLKWKKTWRVFDSSVAIWHSKVTVKKKKKEILNKLQNGDIKLIAGARSALFLPFITIWVDYCRWRAW